MSPLRSPEDPLQDLTEEFLLSELRKTLTLPLTEAELLQRLDLANRAGLLQVNDDGDFEPSLRGEALIAEGAKRNNSS